MRVVFVTNSFCNDSVIILQKLFSSGKKVVGTFTPTQRRKGKSFFATIIAVTQSYGIRTFLCKAGDVLFLQCCVILRKLGLKKKNYSCVEELLADSPLLHKVKRINDQETVEHLKKLKPDVILITFCSQIFSQKVIDIPKYGCINIHRSLLPKYRGPRPIFWALLNAERSVGVTVHFIDKKIDTGTIIAQRGINVLSHDTERTLLRRCAAAGADLGVEVLNRLEKDGSIPTKGQNSVEATYFGRPTKESIKKFRQIMKKRSKGIGVHDF